MVGYELVKGLGINSDEKQKSLDSQKGDKQSQEEYETSLNETITLPVEIEDTILTGRFKNKKTVVKTIGKDEHGMPTINGRKVVNFRLIKEGFIWNLLELYNVKNVITLGISRKMILKNIFVIHVVGIHKNKNMIMEKMGFDSCTSSRKKWD